MKRASLIVIACVFSALACWGGESRSALASVDGEPITREELGFALSPYKASLHLLRALDASAADDSLRAIFDRALSQSIDTKVQQLLAKEHALVGDISYGAFRVALEKENASRRAAHEQGHVVYGPIDFTEHAFFDYLFSNATAELKKLLARRGVDLSPARIRKERDTPSYAQLPFDKASEIIRTRLIDEAFTEHVRMRRALARIEVYEAALREMQHEHVKREQ